MPKKTSADEIEQSEGPGPFWSGTITFGLVTIPVNLYPATRDDRLRLRMLGPDGAPVARRYWCEKDGREVPSDQLVRGFEVEPGKHVLITDDELARLAPEKSRDIELKRFVDAEKLDPVQFDRPYILTPGRNSAKAYRLLARVMEDTGRAGIATFVMSGRERIIAILAEGGIMRAQTVRFADEVRSAEDVGLPPKAKTDRARVAGFEKEIGALAKAALAPSELEDPYAEGLKALVDKKRRSKDRVVVRRDPLPEPVDLVEILKRSLKRDAPARSVRARGAAAKRKASPRRTSSRS